MITSLSKLRIILFWEILKEKNPLLLDADYKPENVYTDEQKEYITDTWTRLYDEYFEAKKDNQGRALLKDSFDEMLLISKITNLAEIRNHLILLFQNINVIPMEQFEALKLSGFAVISNIESKLKLNAFMDIPEAIKLIDRALGSLQNTYSLKTKRIGQEVDKQIENVYKVVARVEQCLERSIPNINEISVLQWLAYEEMANEIVKEKNNGKK